MKRPVLIIALAVVIIAAYVIFVMPLEDKRVELKELLRAKHATLQKYETFLKSADTAEAEANAAVKAVEGMESDILQEKTESLAFAKLQGLIQDFAMRSGMKIISIKPLSVVKYKHYAGLPIQLEAGGGIKQLGEFMKQIDESRQIISIDKLSISTAGMQIPGEMRIRMQVSGLMPGASHNEKA